MKFICRRCGYCCQNAGTMYPELAISEENPRCMFLEGNNFCTIYDTRPLCCNARYMVKYLQKTENMPKNDAINYLKEINCKRHKKTIKLLK